MKNKKKAKPTQEFFDKAYNDAKKKNKLPNWFKGAYDSSKQANNWWKLFLR